MLSQIFYLNSVLKIILIHYISNFLIGLIVRSKAPNISNSNVSFSNSKISTTLIKSINRSITTLLMILGTIVFYMLLSFIITNLSTKIRSYILVLILVYRFYQHPSGITSTALQHT